jgi:hypothetical protein
VLHPALGALARLVGTWQGEGQGHYPTITPFAYHEEVVFGHDGRPFLAYAQRTRRAGADVPAHAESGWLRAVAVDRAELVVAQPTGLAEVAPLAVRTEQGALVLEGARVPLTRAPAAKDVRDVRRRFELDGDELRYDLWMTYAGYDDEHHLRAVLRRVA